MHFLSAIMFYMERRIFLNFINKLSFCTIFVSCALFSIFLFDSPQASSAENNAVVTKNVDSVFSMDDCVNYALKNNPNIKIYQEKQQAQKSMVGLQKSNYFPSLIGGTGYNINNTNYSGNQSNSLNNNYYELNLGINQLIWDFGRTNAKINMQKFNYEAAGYDLDYQILSTIYNVKTSYAAVLAARANEDIYQRSVKINQLNYERTNALYQEGLKSRIDVVNAEVYLTNAKIDLLTAQNLYQTALISLNNAMYYIDAPDYQIKNTENFNFQSDYSVRNEIDIANVQSSLDKRISEGAILTSGIEKRDIIKDYKFKTYPLSFQDAIAKAYENRPDLKSLMLVKNASEESLRAIKKAYMPSVNATAAYSFQKSSDLSTRGLGVYAGVDLPTVNAMNIKYQIEQGKSYLDIAVNNIDLSKKNIYFEVQNYYVNMKLLEKRIPLMSKKVEQTLENFELADGRYTVGLGNFIELQEAQTNYNNAQLAFVQSVFNYNQARFFFEKSMGINTYTKSTMSSMKSKTQAKEKIKETPKGKVLPEIKLNNQVKTKTTAKATPKVKPKETK